MELARFRGYSYACEKGVHAAEETTTISAEYQRQNDLVRTIRSREELVYSYENGD